MAELHYRGVDWQAVIDRVYGYGRQLFRTAGLLDRPITGKGPDDLTKDAIQRLLDPRDSSVEWDEKRGGKPTTEGVVSFLCQVVLRDFIDAKKLPRHTRTGSIEDDKAGHLVRSCGPSPAEEAIERVDRNRKRDELLAFVAEDSEVVEYLRLQLPDEGVIGYPPRKAAEMLSTTVEEINNRKKRVARYLRELEKRRAGERYAKQKA